MKRRDFVKSVFYTSAITGTSLGSLLPVGTARAAHTGAGLGRTLVNTMLLGGADLRFLFAPHPDSDYAHAYWQARTTLYQNNPENKAHFVDYATVWNELYLPVTFNNQVFGIHKSAAWLKDQFDQGNVAIICNVAASENRRHDHSQLIVNTGDLNADQYIYDREGWGGRLASAMGAEANVVAVSHDVSIFCNSVNPGNRLQKVVHVRDSRDFALTGPDGNPVSQRSITARALKAYYAKRGEAVERDIAKGKLDEAWPFRRFFKHEEMLRTFGDQFAEVLKEPGHGPSYYLTRLFTTGSTSTKLNTPHFGKELGNLYDCINGVDVLRLRVASLEFSSFDTHKQEMVALERHLSDLFSPNGGFASLTLALENVQDANENLVHVFTSDFGRQLASNGDNGTDHGRGTYSIIISRNVRGGVYGEMFPQREILPDPNDTQTPQRTPYQQPGADIRGLTSIERVMARVCDWVEPSSGVKVFPNTAKNDLSLYPDGPILEQGVDLSRLFQPGFMINGNTAVINNGTKVNMNDVSLSLQSSNTIAPITTRSNVYGKFSFKGIDDGTYVLTPSKPYFDFSPANLTVNVAGGDIGGIELVAVPRLHIAIIYKTLWQDPTTGEFFAIVRIGGWAFVPGQTQIFLDDREQTPVLLWPNIIFLRLPAAEAYGQITLVTPTERYTHAVPLERV